MTKEELIGVDRGDDVSLDIDPSSKLFTTRLEDLPIPLGGLSNWLKQGRNLKFEVDPTDNSGVIYISSNGASTTNEKLHPEETKLYSFKIPDSITDDSAEYSEYLNDCFKNFEELIKDKTYHNFVSSGSNGNIKIGVVVDDDDPSARMAREHEKQILLNSTISKLIADLGILIEDKLSKQEDPENVDFKLLQLEETMNVLSLIHALYFSTTDEILVLLINWVNRADIQPDLEFTQQILSLDRPFTNVSFWSEYVSKLISRGLFLQAVNAIKESQYDSLEESDNDLFLIVEDLIILLSNYDTVQFSLDNRQFITWKQKCCELRDNFKNIKGDPVIKHALYEILTIMSGQPSSIIKNSSTWYECFLTKYLFELPSQSFITEYLNSSLSNFKEDELDLLTWEKICIDSMKGNYLKVVKLVEILDKPTATYLSVLFEAKGLYSSYDFLLSDNSETLSELLLNDHALECLCHQRLIPVGVGTLLNLNTTATRSVIAQYLPNYHCKTNDDLEWCLSICAKLRLKSTASTILKIKGNDLFDRGQLYEALVLYSKSGDLKILNEKCWLIFENALLQSSKIEDELINFLVFKDSEESNADESVDDIDIADSLRQLLSPYAVLVTFFQLKKDGKLKELLKWLIDLLKFNYLPRKYFPLLLCQLLPFFHSPNGDVQFFASDDLLTQEYLITTLELINKFDKDFVGEVETLNSKPRKTAEEQLLTSLYGDSQLLYRLSVDAEYKDNVKEREFDWRYQFELIQDSQSYPETVESLLLLVREKISLQIGRCFLNDQQ